MIIVKKWTQYGWILWSIGLVCVLIFSICGFYKIMRRRRSRIDPSHTKSSFQTKMARAFAFFVAIPCFILAFFSIYFLHIGIHTWFDRRVQKAVQGAHFISQQYLIEQQRLIERSSSRLMQSLQTIFSTRKPPSENLDRP